LTPVLATGRAFGLQIAANFKDSVLADLAKHGVTVEEKSG